MPATLPTDRCPKCLALLNVQPGAWRVDAGEVRCAYRCPDADCAHIWTTRWALGVLGGLDGAA